jgi:hypothetical protein
MRAPKLTIAVLAAVITLPSLAGPAIAQTPGVQQRFDSRDPCSGSKPIMSAHDCMDAAYERGDKDAWLKWAAIIVAQEGNWILAGYIAVEYSDNRGDWFHAWIWYDIRAAVHGHEIAQMPPATSASSIENNAADLSYRDDAAKHLTTEQIAQAAAISRQWLREHHY